jgi:filamentous hemagglutinin family protein
MRPLNSSLCSTLAIATALLCPAVAKGQDGSFLGTWDVVKGSAGVVQVGATADTLPTTTVTVNSNQAVINWSATGPTSGGVQTFQADGTALFQNGRNQGDYAVLNRILPGSAGAKISMNGIINSVVNGATGGTVYFYSPNGIVIGSSAQIDVGRLGLTTADPWDGVSDSWLSGNQVTFSQAAAGSSVQVNSGATINALTEGSYVALVAPVINHAGSIAVNGQAALVAAEAATVTFNPNGLFDIQVTVGSGGAGEKITSTGDITGPASSGAGDNHRIYMVAVPKNEAITMALTGGTLGFDVAGAAEVIGNAVVLSAGHNVSGGYADSEPAPASSGTASITVRSPQVTSALYATASDSISLGVVDATAHYWSDVNLAAANNVAVFADDFGNLNIDGFLSANANRRGTLDGEDITGGNVTLLASSNGNVMVGKAVNLAANAFGGDSLTAGANAGNATGGTITVRTTGGGSIDVTDDLNIYADARGGDLHELGGTAGSGTGGDVFVENLGTGGSIAVGGFTYVEATGQGGGPWDCSECGGIGGDGTGGNVRISGGDGEGHSTTLAGVLINVEGQGGRGETGASGRGTGGTVDLLALNGASLITGSTSIDAYGYGGSVFSPQASGALGTGGTVNVRADAGLIQTGSLSINAIGNGSFAGFGLPSGDGQGGVVSIKADNGGIVSLASLDVNATGNGGNNNGGSAGGNGQGGEIHLNALSGSSIGVIESASLTADGASGFSGGECIGCSGAGGNGTGGSIDIGDETGGTGNFLSFGGDLYLSTIGYGGTGSSGAGGIGQGGFIDINLAAGLGMSVAGALTAEARGIGGGNDNGGQGGSGKGGTILLTVAEAPVEGFGLFVGEYLQLTASADGGDAYEVAGGSGGTATGGKAEMQVNGGSVSVGGSLEIYSRGTGGSASDGTGGDGTGSATALTVSGGGGLSVANEVELISSGRGGDGAVGGAGTGGSGVNGARVNLSDGAMVVASLDVHSKGRGGEGYVSGGNGTGGDASIRTSNSVDFIQSTGLVSVNADGIGGGEPEFDFGGFGLFALPTAGNGLGGNAELIIAAGDLSAPSLSVTSIGTGGDMAAGVGGNGTGKLALISASDGGTIQIAGDATADASGVGGIGLVGGTGTGGGLFDGQGFGIGDGGQLFAHGGTIGVSGKATALANGTGGAGTFGSGGSGGTGQGGWATITAANSDFGLSTISAASGLVSVLGQGGAGGDGAAGGAGGNGGDGFGGRTGMFASAGTGKLSIGDAVLVATGTGGHGGNGGSGPPIDSAGGNGGTGGAAEGGLIELGIESGKAEALTSALGSAIFTTASADASATGGEGGTGGDGLGSSNGGDGGDAVAGRSILLVRGGKLDVTQSASLVANANGGAGGTGFGSGGLTGQGGDALVAPANGVIVRMSERNGVGTRGTLTAGNVTATAIATAGNGGTSQNLGGSGLFVRNGDASFDSLAFTISADAQASGALAEAISVLNGTVAADTLSFSTTGKLSLFVDNGLLDVGTLTLSAADFVPSLTEPPGAAGLIKAQTASITTGNNFTTSANMEVASAFQLVAPGSITIADLTGGSSLDLTAQGGSITLGNVTSAGNTSLHANNSVSALGFDVGGFLSVLADNGFIQGADVLATGAQFQADGDIEVGDIASDGSAFLSSAGGKISAGDIDAAFSVDVDAAGNILVGDVTSTNSDISLTSTDGTINGGNLAAGARIIASAPGAITLQDVTTAGSFSEVGYDVNMQSGTSIEAGAINSKEGINLISGGPLDVASLTAVDDILLLASGDVTTGGITGGANSDLLIADSSLGELGGSLSFFNSNAVLGAFPFATGGSASINGPVNIGGNLVSRTAGAFGATSAVQAATVDVESGGNAAFGGAVTSGGISVTSTDIDIGAGGSVTSSGQLLLLSQNGTQMRIGDGLSGSGGYLLSNAEFGKLDGASIFIGGRGDTSSAQDMLIGDLSIGGGQIGGEGTLGLFTFANGESGDPGVLRVAGNMLATGFNLDQGIEFETGLFQLDAATGSVSITGQGYTLSGYIDISADRMHVASAAILDKLAANPLYEGREDELNAPAAVQRPEGVLRSFDITVFGAQQILVQNTGTNTVQAGIIAADGDIIGQQVAAISALALEPIEMIINGQIATEGGTITGAAVWEAITTDEEFDGSLFTSNSSINGCALSAAVCVVGGGGGPNDPFLPPTDAPRPDVTFGEDPPLADKLFATEEASEDSCSANKPEWLVDGCALNDVRPIEEPVSGSGNPALIGGAGGNP